LKHRYRAALLDFDLTLVDMSDIVDWKSAGTEVGSILLKNGFDISGLKYLPVSLLREAARFDSGPEGTRKERWSEASRKLCAYECRGALGASMRDGCMELLKYLRESRMRTAITSSNCREAIDSCLRRMNIDGFVDVSVSRDEVLWEMKPNPRPVEMALEALSAPPEETFGLGDSVVDMSAFLACGVTPFGITGGMADADELKEAGAEIVFNSLFEVIGELDHSTR
jgi:phosphoglycolate phosphatase-like HAD superfamily hydrolase